MELEVDLLLRFSKELHSLNETEVQALAVTQLPLQGLPRFHHTAADFTALKLNESLAQLYVYTQSFKVYVAWLKTAQDRVGMPSKSTGGASAQLHTLSDRLSASLQQINEELPQSPPPPPSFPLVSTTFDGLNVSAQVAQQLQTFCYWSKQVLRTLERQF
ncbi:interleukin-11-like [Betta splendens]|uniref:Interleukin-11-like n=1 Tax=Betta splendens TaxID=158456 RepID=A0A6P7NZG9_BETSP|nr:interleukin-11-like [Betta splendens]